MKYHTILPQHFLVVPLLGSHGNGGLDLYVILKFW